MMNGALRPIWRKWGSLSGGLVQRREHESRCLKPSSMPRSIQQQQQQPLIDSSIPSEQHRGIRPLSIQKQQCSAQPLISLVNPARFSPGYQPPSHPRSMHGRAPDGRREPTTSPAAPPCTPSTACCLPPQQQQQHCHRGSIQGLKQRQQQPGQRGQ